MRILLGAAKRLVLVLALVLLVGAPAFADVVVNDCKPNDDSGCSCDHGTFHTCDSTDMALPSVPHDLAAPHDLTSPPDACRELRRSHNRARGRGLVLLSGLSVLAVLALRRRGRA